MNHTIGLPCHHKNRSIPVSRSGCRDYDPNHHSKEALTHFVSAPWCPKRCFFLVGKMGGRNKTGVTPPRSLTQPLKRYLPNRKVVFQPPFFRGYVKLRGCTYRSPELLDGILKLIFSFLLRGASPRPRLTRIVAKPKALLSRHCKKVQSSPATRFLPLSLSFLNQLTRTHWTSARSTSEISQLNFPRENNASRVRMDQNGFSSEIVKYQLG